MSNDVFEKLHGGFAMAGFLPGYLVEGEDGI